MKDPKPWRGRLRASWGSCPAERPLLPSPVLTSSLQPRVPLWEQWADGGPQKGQSLCLQMGIETELLQMPLC